MDDSTASDASTASEGLEHLQTAAREVLKAARSFLDVVEDVVEDPDKLSGAATGVGDLLRRGFARPDPAWADSAWAESASAESASSEDRSGRSRPAHAADRDDGDDGDDPTPASTLTSPDPATAARTRRATSRVRRIAVD